MYVFGFKNVSQTGSKTGGLDSNHFVIYRRNKREREIDASWLCNWFRNKWKTLVEDVRIGCKRTNFDLQQKNSKLKKSDI